MSIRWQSRPNPLVIPARHRGRGCNSSCSKRIAMSNGRGWIGRAHPRSETVPSTGPSHAWIREEAERVEDFCYTYTTEYQKL